MLTQIVAQSNTPCSFDYECNLPYGQCVIDEPELSFPGFGLDSKTGILYFISNQEPNVTFGKHVFRVIDLNASPKTSQVVGTVPQCDASTCQFYFPSPINGVYGAGQGNVFWSGAGLGSFLTIFNAPINKLGTCSLNQNIADNCDGTLEIFANIRGQGKLAFPDPAAVSPEIRDCIFFLIVVGTRNCPGNVSIIAGPSISSRLILIATAGKPFIFESLRSISMKR
jgi:hypothetical protein